MSSVVRRLVVYAGHGAAAATVDELGLIGSGNRGRSDGGGGMAERRCRCHLPLDLPPERHWWPSRDPEPDTGVRAVALAGEDPGFLRTERRPDGWHTEGHAAAYPEATPSRGWGDVGRCWDAAEHPVVDVSDWLAQHRANLTSLDRGARVRNTRIVTPDGAHGRRRSPEGPWARIDGATVTVPIIVSLPDDRARR